MSDSRKRLGMVHFGLGTIGLEVARLVSQRPYFFPVAAVDQDPSLIGQDFAQLVDKEAKPDGIKVGDISGLTMKVVDVVAHCTGSSLEAVIPQLLACVSAGLDVVSTCEELSYPWDTSPAQAEQLDAAAKEAGVSILGTGVNPGFAMDYLPIVLTGASRRVDRVRVHRVQDAGQRRLPLQRKVGVGLDREEFQHRVEAGSVRHVGLRESAQAVAAALGWRLTKLDEMIEPIIAEAPTPSGLGEIAPGRVTGVRQVATGIVEDREVVELELEMAVGLDSPRDEILITGDPDIQMIIPGGLHGDVATAAVVVNALRRIVDARPGLVTMADLPPPHP